MKQVFKNRIPLFLAGLSILSVMLFLVCTGERNNPLDKHNPNFVPPSISIDTTGVNIGKGDTIAVDSATITVTGNRSESRFRAHIDSSVLSQWQGSGAFYFDSLTSGRHVVIIESKYEGWDVIVTDSIVFFVRNGINSAKALTSFHFAAPAVTGTINDSAKTVAVCAPYGINVTALVASFVSTGSSVKVGSTVQVSGTTTNNFSSSVTYTVIAADSSTQDYVVTVTVSPNTVKTLTSFNFPSLAVTGTVNEASKTVAVIVPYGTNVMALVATFSTTGATVKVGSTAQVSGTTTNDFTSPVAYAVMAADSSKQDYVVTVKISPNTAKALTFFSFKSLSVSGTINDSAKTVAVTVPFGANVTALVTTFASTGSSVKIAGVSQVSGVTVNNFSNPVAYTITAADNSTQDYVVTVSVAANSAKALTLFGFISPAVTGTINDIAKTVTVSVPYGTSVNALVATFAATGATVKVGSTVQVSGKTVNNFSLPVTYTVMAADSSKQDYEVTVMVSTNTAKALTSFRFTSPAATGTINDTARTVAVTVPYGTNVAALVATFATTGSSAKIASVSQVSGVTANNFSNPVAYTITAADNSTQEYVVTVTVSPNTTKALTSFSFPAISVTGTISDAAKTIAVTVPYGTNVTALVATFATTGSSVKIASVLQVSGVTANNFSNPVAYTITAADNSTQDYVVTVTVSPNTAKALTSFGFPSLAVTGTINDAAKTVAVTVPYGTNVTALAATFVSTGSSVKVGSTAQVSGTTTNNFSSPVTYTVAAADSSKLDYVVTVTVSPNTAKTLTSFSFSNPAVTGTVNDAAKTVAVTVPFGTNVTALVATFVSTGASVKIAGVSQVSGVTANNFTNPVAYTITAADNTTQDYVVTVSVAANPAKALISFSFTSPVVAGTVSEAAKTVAVSVPYGTSVTALVATFTTTGATVKVGFAVQTSGTTPNNFTSPVTYTVTAADNSTQDYVVTVSILPYNFTVTFDGQSATVGPNPSTKSVIAPATTVGTLPTAPQKNNYQFDGWYTGTNGAGSAFTATTVVTQSLIVYAKWLMDAPAITSHPSTQTTPLNGVTFTVIATGDSLRYQWQKNNTDITGATMSSYAPAQELADTGSAYRCIVNNSKGSIASNAAIWSVSTVKDVDSNVYHQVKIGSQVWTIENLRVTKYKDGTTAIPKDTSTTTWANATTPKYCYYNNTSSADSIKKFGALYNWYVVGQANVNKIAPMGWHVPTNAEWDTLQNYLIANGYNWDNTTTGNKIAKSMAAKTDWTSSTTAGAIGNNLAANNKSGFSALPGSFRGDAGTFYSQSMYGYWWSATEYDASYANNSYLYPHLDYLGRGANGKICGFSVRLVRDN